MALQKCLGTENTIVDTQKNGSEHKKMMLYEDETASPRPTPRYPSKEICGTLW